MKNYLYNNSHLQISYNFNILPITQPPPNFIPLPQIIQTYLNHQIQLLTNTTPYHLHQPQKPIHILQRLIKPLSILHEVIPFIPNSKNKKHPKHNLIPQYHF
ncbi:DNA gyrase subunit A, partial [Staphylococcus epidermidis]|uniref:DNA gyrase subunit A n=1 Tax=Staphylococcus epidermidis TaxID=1282 RepID=UPI0037DA748E